MAATCRDYLDKIGYTDTKIMLLAADYPVISKTLGSFVTNEIHKLMKKKRISVIANCQLRDFEGDTKLEKIVFRKEEECDVEKEMEVGVTDHFVQPDFVIADNGIGKPKMDLKKFIDSNEKSTVNCVNFDNYGIPSSNIRFSLYFNTINSPLNAAGSCTNFPSFLHKIRIRVEDVKYNIEQGFYAAMNLMDKQV
jgi:hypothetical protein